MTLIRNGKEFNLFDETDPVATKELKKFKEKFPWFTPDVGLRVNLSPKFKKPARGEHNQRQKLIDKPNKFNLPLHYTVMTDKGPLKMVYVERYDGIKDGIIQNGYPANFELRDDMTINFQKIDYAYFLYTYPACGNGANFHPSVMGEIYRIEEPEIEAQVSLEGEMLVLKVKKLILNDPIEGGLTFDELQKIALSYQIKLEKNGHPKTVTEVRNEVLIVLNMKQGKMGTEKAYNQFLSLLDKREELQSLSELDFAKSKGIIRVKGVPPGQNQKGNMSWCLMAPDGTTIIKRFAYHRKSKQSIDHDPFLLKEIESNPGLMDEIRQAIDRERVLA
jgi:hypothetical protein